jgi:type II secretory pathway predicted ATPase ExeA
MAKRGRPGKTAAERKIVDYAENLGHFLGSVRAKVSTWNSERQQLVKHLSALVSDAQGLLTELGHEAAGAGRRTRRAVVAATERRVLGRKRRKMSAAARAKISAAQKKRWARVKAERA